KSAMESTLRHTQPKSQSTRDRVFHRERSPVSLSIPFHLPTMIGVHETDAPRLQRIVETESRWLHPPLGRQTDACCGVRILRMRSYRGLNSVRVFRTTQPEVHRVGSSCRRRSFRRRGSRACWGPLVLRLVSACPNTHQNCEERSRQRSSNYCSAPCCRHL